jgi:hypothetical protein
MIDQKTAKPIAPGACSRSLKGKRVRVVHGSWPRPNQEATIYGVTGGFVEAHDEIGYLECVHTDQQSSMWLKFDDDTIISGFPMWSVVLL